MKFDQLTKNKLRNFDQTPKLTETFDQLIRSSEIRSTDPLSFVPLQSEKFYIGFFLTNEFEAKKLLFAQF